jgi:hypothetical protein
LARRARRSMRRFSCPHRMTDDTPVVRRRELVRKRPRRRFRVGRIQAWVRGFIPGPYIIETGVRALLRPARDTPRYPPRKMLFARISGYSL